jgi:type II secretory pathway pseudopilin PulG
MHWIRRRFAGTDEGLSLVEVLVSLFVLSVALLALLGSFLTSAKSVQSQQARSQAQRAAQEQLELYRSLPFSAITDDSGERRTAEGTLVRYETVVTTEDEVNPDGETVQVKRVTTTVYYSVNGKDEQVVYQTTVRPEAGHVGVPDVEPTPTPTPTSTDPAGPAPGFTSFSFSPEPVVVDSAGTPTEDVLVTIVLTGFPASEIVRVSWRNDDGTTRSVSAISSDGSTWKATVARSALVHYQSPNTTGVVDFTARTSTGLESRKGLQVRGPTLDPPRVIDLTVSPEAPIRVDNKTGAPQSNLRFTCLVAGLDAASGPHSVRLVYLDRSGTQKELAMSPNLANDVWTLSVAAGGQVTFQGGNRQPFTCNVTRHPDFAPGSLTKQWKVL